MLVSFPGGTGLNPGKEDISFIKSLERARENQHKLKTEFFFQIIINNQGVIRSDGSDLFNLYST